MRADVAETAHHADEPRFGSKQGGHGIGDPGGVVIRVNGHRVGVDRNLVQAGHHAPRGLVLGGDSIRSRLDQDGFEPQLAGPSEQ